MITRTLSFKLQNIAPGTVHLIYGPRRVGKTVLLDQLIESQFAGLKSLYLNGDTQEARDALSSTSAVRLAQLVKDYNVIAIDEAQRIPNIGLSLKILVDTFPDKHYLVTGSSSLELAKGMHEPLTGRNTTYMLFPLSTAELTSDLQPFQKSALLPSQLLYGGYPQLTAIATDLAKQQYLLRLTEDYLFKDLFTLAEFRDHTTVRQLATLLAFQIGSEVSLNELANKLNLSVATVQRYLELLKLGFIIFEVGAFSTNLRTEVVRNKKYYFYDLGIRNAIINQFHPLESRADLGSLWENFCAVERRKTLHYANRHVETFFWRNYSQAEVDWVEREGTALRAYEFKYSQTSARTPKAFATHYNLSTTLINKSSYFDFIAAQI